jgi:hypothetical protein
MPKPCTLDDLARHASAATRRLNPDLFGAGHTPRLGSVDTAQHREPARTLERTASPRRCRKALVDKGGRPETTITMTAHLRRDMDDDNLAASLKPLRDAIADWLGVDDGDKSLRWECGQVRTYSEEGVSVRIVKEGIHQ